MAQESGCLTCHPTQTERAAGQAGHAGPPHLPAVIPLTSERRAGLDVCTLEDLFNHKVPGRRRKGHEAGFVLRALQPRGSFVSPRRTGRCARRISTAGRGPTFLGVPPSLEKQVATLLCSVNLERTNSSFLRWHLNVSCQVASARSGSRVLGAVAASGLPRPVAWLLIPRPKPGPDPFCEDLERELLRAAWEDVGFVLWHGRLSLVPSPTRSSHSDPEPQEPQGSTGPLGSTLHLGPAPRRTHCSRFPFVPVSRVGLLLGRPLCASSPLPTALQLLCAGKPCRSAARL